MHLTHSRETFALLHDLLNSPVITARYDCHARPFRIERFSNRDRLDIETASAKQTNDTRELAGLISNYDGKCVAHKTHWTIMSRELAPAGTIGNTFSSFETTSSNTATPGCAKAAARTLANSDGFCARKPAAP